MDSRGLRIAGLPVVVPLLFAVAPGFLTGCATTTARGPRPFFTEEHELETHGRKTWFDHLIETDPGHVDFQVAPEYASHPPLRIAVLPFGDRGNGDYLVNKIPILPRSEKERDAWSWTHANRLRHAVTGELAAREFVVVPPLAVDSVLADRGVTDREKLDHVSVEELGRWLGVDAVVYGDLVEYEAYYFLLVAAWRISAELHVVATRNGQELFSCFDERYDASVSPAFDPVDIGINSLLNLLTFRDVSLARTEYEVGRELVLRLPIAERNVSAIQTLARARSHAPDPDVGQVSAPLPLQPAEAFGSQPLSVPIPGNQP